MNKNLYRLFATTALVTLVTGGSAIAGENNSISPENAFLQTMELAQVQNRWGGNREQKQSRLIEELNLTSEQQQQMQGIKARYEPQMVQLREEIQTERQKLQTMMTGSESTENIRAQHQTIANLNQRMRSLGFESMMEMRQVLTPEQRQQFAQMMNQRRGQYSGQNR